jgi:hypothetical protein
MIYVVQALGLLQFAVLSPPEERCPALFASKGLDREVAAPTLRSGSRPASVGIISS